MSSNHSGVVPTPTALAYLRQLCKGPAFQSYEGDSFQLSQVRDVSFLWTFTPHVKSGSWGKWDERTTTQKDIKAG
ncbi:hypothetical protein DAPPUDRAFT_254000 [Daphnia pulex]|uniref:Uncharacterized protein n=1 Tax=Daphnia pulex TaxID=6669 RepID=E9H637_DAPPU|nr:hypothetical protein DAPPUDRAFT_254000 [Daphnia pulex]|eukprot:EFX72739.1 hypothetical protein DAPPUDRAFT_254000 [Daphnia pulex]